LVTIVVEDQLGGPAPANGDVQPPVLHLTDYGIERTDNGPH
jgi:hypothetical protein